MIHSKLPGYFRGISRWLQLLLPLSLMYKSKQFQSSESSSTYSWRGISLPTRPSTEGPLEIKAASQQPNNKHNNLQISLLMQYFPFVCESMHYTSFVFQNNNAHLINTEHVVNNVLGFHKCWIQHSF